MKVFIILSLLLTTCAKAEQTQAPVVIPEVASKKESSDATPIDTRTAQEKYEARDLLTEEEYQSLRQPVPDWDTFNRLVRVEDGFDDLRRFYLDTNTVAPNLNWLDIVYYDPQKESYYYGKFKPIIITIDGFDYLINIKKNPAHQVYGRDRVVLITNLSPSMHIYADAYNNYQLYALELKSTIDEYGVYLVGSYYSDIVERAYTLIYHPLDGISLDIKWKVVTNEKTWRFPHVEYVAVTNGVPIISPAHSPYNIRTYLEILQSDYRVVSIYDELTNTNKTPVTYDLKEKTFSIPYTEETKNIYYGEKYDFYGDIAELTNEISPSITNYDDWYRTTKDILHQDDEQSANGSFRRSDGVLNITI
ncbi:MAG: hypothetical protein ACRC9L_01450 [Brevinema sp.]